MLPEYVVVDVDRFEPLDQLDNAPLCYCIDIKCTVTLLWLQNPSWQRIELAEQHRCNKGADEHISLHLWARPTGHDGGTVNSNAVRAEPQTASDPSATAYSLAMRYTVDMKALRFHVRRVGWLAD